MCVAGGDFWYLHTTDSIEDVYTVWMIVRLFFLIAFSSYEVSLCSIPCKIYVLFKNKCVCVYVCTVEKSLFLKERHIYCSMGLAPSNGKFKTFLMESFMGIFLKENWQISMLLQWNILMNKKSPNKWQVKRPISSNPAKIT